MAQHWNAQKRRQYIATAVAEGLTVERATELADHEALILAEASRQLERFDVSLDSLTDEVDEEGNVLPKEGFGRDRKEE